MVQAGPLKSQPPVILVVGPTASGKSEWAEQWAGERNGEILNADSQQFYRGMDIGTGKVDSKKSALKHWFLDICEPGEFMTGMDFARQADDLIAALREEGKTPVVVGGTGLYVRCLFEGLDPLPSRDEGIRARLQAEMKEKGAGALHRRLSHIDPVLGAKIHPHDPSRIIRFLEIHEITGRPPSEILSGKRPETLRYPTHTYWFHPSREKLRERIALRVQAMIASGWVEEVRDLMGRGVDPRRIPNKPIGYADLADVVEGQMSLEKAREKITLRTQQYAKRQATFFRALLKHPAYQTGGSKLDYRAAF